MAIRSWLDLRGTPYYDRQDEFYWLWIIATATYGVGDVVTTIALVYYHPLTTEANPVLRWAMSTFGLGGLLGVKLGIFLVFIGVSLVLARRGYDPLLYSAPPAILAALGGYLTVFNLVVMAGLG